LLKVYESLWMQTDSRSNIASACLRGCRSLVEIRGLTPMQHLSIRKSLVSTSTATHPTMDGCTEMCGFQFPVFYPASRPASGSIRTWVCVTTSLWWLRQNPLTKPVWSDYYDSDTLCTVSDFMAAYGEGR